MASIKLNKVKAVGADFPNNTEPEFRFASDPMASITIPVPGVWIHFPFPNAVNFNGNGKIELFFHGMFISASNKTVNETPGSNHQVSIPCGYGKYLVRYTVTNP